MSDSHYRSVSGCISKKTKVYGRIRKAVSNAISYARQYISVYYNLVKMSEEQFEFKLVTHYNTLQEIEKKSKETVELFEKWYLM